MGIEKIISGLNKEVTGIVAVSDNNVIGVSKYNEMPWRLGEYENHPFWNNMKDPNSFRRQDMDHFMKTTKNNTVIMGKKTYESIDERFRPLKDRYNIILSRTQKGKGDSYRFVSNETQALELAKTKPGNIFIMGGSQIYDLFMPYMDSIIVTQINKKFKGDIVFNISSDFKPFYSKPLGTIDPKIANILIYRKSFF